MRFIVELLRSLFVRETKAKTQRMRLIASGDQRNVVVLWVEGEGIFQANISEVDVAVVATRFPSQDEGVTDEYDVLRVHTDRGYVVFAGITDEYGPFSTYYTDPMREVSPLSFEVVRTENGGFTVKQLVATDKLFV
ncbi:MAG TPA: hypothetical protein VFO38_03085 [Candidatus Saccharimonadales bacterium]|nr:hypothetical protein [Candidatus Saccharimonadales bacterium]